jgi:hypothetical protein
MVSQGSGAIQESTISPVRHFTEVAMNPQLPQGVEIGYSTSRMLRLAGLGVVMTLASASVALNWYASNRIDDFYELVGYAGIVFFGLATLVIVWRLLTAKGPVVFISRQGIRDTRVVNDLIPWGLVEDIVAREYRRQKFVLLKISPVLERQLFATKGKQAMMAASKALGFDGVTITASGLAMDFDTLFATCTAYYSAVKAPKSGGAGLAG